MSDTIEKIQRYIEKSNVPCNVRYDASFKEVIAMASEMAALDAVVLAFNYGRTKGYRAAKAEAGANRA